MTEEEKKRYFGVLIEDLYNKLHIVSEGTVQNKKEIATKLINEFYREFKDEYGIDNIEKIITALAEVNEKVKNVHKQKESGER